MKGGGILLGIDVGTTVLKLCAFSRSTGALRDSAIRRLAVRALPGGGRETEAESLDRALRSAAGEISRRVGRAWSAVEGIGLAAQGGSSIIAERSSGAALTPMILWSDGRSRAHLARLESEVRLKSSSRRSPSSRSPWLEHALSEVPPAGLGRLLWLREARPELFGDASFRDNIHAGAGERVFFRLTGIWRQDAGNAVQIGSYDAARGRLDDSLLDLVGVPLSFFAPLRRGHETAPLSRRGARLLGLAEGIPVAGPYIDQEAGYLSSVGAFERPLQCSLGTAWVGNFILPEGLRGESPVQLVIASPVGPGRLVILPLLAGNAAWEWGLATLVDPDPERAVVQADALLSGSLAPPAGLVALPWLTQPNPLRPCLEGGGALFGLNPRTGRADLLRALAASLALELDRVLEDVRDSGALDGVLLSGGASRSSFIRRWIAALFEPLPVLFEVRGEVSSAARGALHAFGSRASRAAARPVAAPRGEALREIHQAQSIYRSLFEKIFGGVAAARPFRIAARREPNTYAATQPRRKR